MKPTYEEKRAIFGRSAFFAKRGYLVDHDVPEFYYVTPSIMVCPPLDGLKSLEELAEDPRYSAALCGMSFVSEFAEMSPQAIV